VKALLIKRHNRGTFTAKSTTRFKSLNERSFDQYISYDLALDANTLAVNYPDDAEALLACGFEISNSDRLDVLRRKSMEIDGVGDLDFDWLGKWIVGLLGDDVSLFVSMRDAVINRN
jgi:hypothetical protein